MKYDNFKELTISADETITKAKDLRAVSEDFADGFHKGMYEAREIFMKLEDEDTSDTGGRNQAPSDCIAAIQRVVGDE